MHSALTKILPPITYDFSITSLAPKCTAPYSRRNVCFQLSLNFYWIYPRLYLSVTGSTSSISTLNLSLKQNLSDFSLEYQICIFPLKSKLLFHDVDMEEVVVVRRGQGRQLHHEFWPAPDSSSPFRFDFFCFPFCIVFSSCSCYVFSWKSKRWRWSGFGAAGSIGGSFSDSRVFPLRDVFFILVGFPLIGGEYNWSVMEVLIGVVFASDLV
jgi:hypothetical protein